MLFKCPKCEKQTTFDFCNNCKIPTNPILPMELKTDKSIKNITGETVIVDKALITTDRTHEFDLHNFRYRFDIWNVHNFNKGAVRQMRGWKAYTIRVKDYTIQVNPKSFFIITTKRYKTADPVATEKSIEQDIINTAIKFAKDNNLRINDIPIPIGKEVKIIDCCINENFRTSNFKSVYPVPSPVEFTNPEYAPKDSVKFIANLDDWVKLQQQQIIINSEFSKNIKLHMETMQNINKSLENIEKLATKQTLLQRLKKLITNK